MTHVEIQAPEECLDEEVRKRASECSNSRNTRRYKVVDDGREVAFLALDFRRDLDCIALYELFVPKQLRRKGTGSQIVREVEDVARREGYAKVTVYPSPLEPGGTTAELVRWYTSQGYKKRRGCPSEMEKHVT